MKKIAKIFILLVVLGALVFQFRVQLSSFFYDFKSYIFPQNPCAEPIVYTLGTFDDRFNISPEYFLSAIADAAAIWEKPSGRNLFAYPVEGPFKKALKINLIYDYRQEATSKLASLGIVVKDNQASYDALKIKLTELKAKFEMLKSDYEIKAQSFNQEKKFYEEQVVFWNKRGGAPKKEYDQLQDMKSALDAKARELQTLQKQINEMVEEINTLVVALNRLVNTLNLSVEKYNTIGASRGESFTEGVYFVVGGDREIDIYEFSDRAKLVWVLAHELGHALDLGHVEDTKAIMYKFNQGDSEMLTKADLDALKTKCGVEY